MMCTLFLALIFSLLFQITSGFVYIVLGNCLHPVVGTRALRDGALQISVLQFDKLLVETWSNHSGHHESAPFVDAWC